MVTNLVIFFICTLHCIVEGNHTLTIHILTLTHTLNLILILILNIIVIMTLKIGGVWAEIICLRDRYNILKSSFVYFDNKETYFFPVLQLPVIVLSSELTKYSVCR